MADEHWRHLAHLDPHTLDQLMAEYGQTVWNCHRRTIIDPSAPE
jgi:hypothetical protein